MRHTIALTLGLLLLLLPAREARGQWREAGAYAAAPGRAESHLPAVAPRSAAPPFIGYTILGSAVGAATGTVVGGLLGGAITSQDCETGNPDACFFEAVPGLLVGAGLGYAVGAPVGAHLGNGRRGRLGPSLLVTSALFGVQAATVLLIGEQAATPLERGAIPVVFLAIPAAQLIGAIVLERRTAAERARAENLRP